MDAVKFPKCDAVAVAAGCFDLPLAQMVCLCTKCDAGRMPNNEECADCNGSGYSRFALISCWELSPEELAIVNKTGKIWLHVCTTQTPPVLVDVHDPFEHYSDIILLRDHIQK